MEVDYLCILTHVLPLYTYSCLTLVYLLMEMFYLCELTHKVPYSSVFTYVGVLTLYTYSSGGFSFCPYPWSSPAIIYLLKAQVSYPCELTNKVPYSSVLTHLGVLPLYTYMEVT